MEVISRIQLMKAICSSKDVGNIELKQELEELYNRHLVYEDENNSLQRFYPLSPDLSVKIENLVHEYTKRQKELIARIY